MAETLSMQDNLQLLLDAHMQSSVCITCVCRVEIKIENDNKDMAHSVMFAYQEFSKMKIPICK